MVETNLSWEVVQTKDTIDPKSDHYNPKSAIAKTVRFENDKQPTRLTRLVWGGIPDNVAKDDSGCAHSNKKMTCQACHSSWNPTCYGCHLPQKANYKMPQIHNEGDVTRNYTAYDWQTLRDEVFMLGKDGNATGNRTNCARSSCAVHVTSFNNNRESIYTQQQTHSAEGLSGIAFSTNVPHTVSGKGTTKSCTDCHLSKDNDNNAIMAQLLMQGTNYMNFMGRYCWVAAKEHGLFGVVVTEQEEPQAVLGSSLHKIAFPEEFEKLEKHGRMLKEAHEHPGVDIGDKLFHPWRKVEVLSTQARGEYLYAACGEQGLKVFDIAFIDDKGFSERFNTAPVSPLGQRFYVETKYATYATAPATTAPDPTRRHYVENHEGSIAGIYAYIFVCDKYEGLVLVGAGTLLDGDPLNNYLKRALTFNPGNVLCGARYISFVGTYGYVISDAGSGGHRLRGSAEAGGQESHRTGVSAESEDGAGSVPLCLCGGRRGSEGLRHYRSGESAADQQDRGARHSQHVPGPHLCLPRGGQERPGNSGYRTSGGAEDRSGLHCRWVYHRPA